MHTPFLPAFRSRLAALGRRSARALRQATLGQLQDQLRDLLPAPLLSSEEEGLNSRERDFPLRLTFECFLWQMLKPRTACREVVRHVQALRTLHGHPIANCAANYGTTCCWPWRAIWCPSDPTAPNLAPSNVAPSPIPCSTGAPQIRGNLTPQPLLERQTTQLSWP